MPDWNMVFWMFMASLVSAFPAALLAFYLTLRVSMKGYLRDLPALLDKPDLVYALKQAADKWNNARSSENEKAQKAQATAMRAELKVEIDAMLNTKITQLGQQLSDQQTAQAEKMYNELRGLMGSFSKNFVAQINGEGGRGGPLDKFGKAAAQLDQLTALVTDLRGKGGGGNAGIPNIMRPYQ